MEEFGRAWGSCKCGGVPMVAEREKREKRDKRDKREKRDKRGIA